MTPELEMWGIPIIMIDQIQCCTRHHPQSRHSDVFYIAAPYACIMDVGEEVLPYTYLPCSSQGTKAD
jgi:hypothetical protein